MYWPLEKISVWGLESILNSLWNNRKRPASLRITTNLETWKICFLLPENQGCQPQIGTAAVACRFNLSSPASCRHPAPRYPLLLKASTGRRDLCTAITVLSWAWHPAQLLSSICNWSRERVALGLPLLRSAGNKSDGSRVSPYHQAPSILP